MQELNLAKINEMLTEAVGYANEFTAAPKLKEYSKKVAAQDLLRKARQMITAFNNEITNEYRKRKLESKKKDKAPEGAKKPSPSPAPAEEKPQDEDKTQPVE